MEYELHLLHWIRDPRLAIFKEEINYHASLTLSETRLFVGALYFLVLNVEQPESRRQRKTAS